jgi:LPXTG-site transpeptidase (sortase) family protein
MTGPLGWLIIPNASLYAPIYTAPIVGNIHQLSDHGVGHLEGTTWIDDGWGRVVLAGHNPGVFEPILTLGVGDRIIVISHQGAYEFEVTRNETVFNNRKWIAPTNEPTLTLITCEDRGKTWRIIEAMLKD